MKNQYHLPCNIAQTLNLIGDKWTLLILHAIFVGKHSYKELQAALTGIPTNLLSTRLKALEQDGLIEMTLYQAHPPRYEYHLSEAGKDLEDVFNVLVLWGEAHLTKCYKRLSHKECHAPVHIAYICEDCGKVVDRSELEVLAMEEHQSE